MSPHGTTQRDASGLDGARKLTGISIVLLVIFVAIIVSSIDVSGPLVAILACSPIIPAVAYFAYAFKRRS